MFCSSEAGADVGVFWRRPPGAAVTLTGCGAGLNSSGVGAGAGVGAIWKGAFGAAVTLVGCGAGSSSVYGAVDLATGIKALGAVLSLGSWKRGLGKGRGRRLRRGGAWFSGAA